MFYSFYNGSSRGRGQDYWTLEHNWRIARDHTINHQTSLPSTLHWLFGFYVYSYYRLSSSESIACDLRYSRPLVSMLSAFNSEHSFILIIHYLFYSPLLILHYFLLSYSFIVKVVLNQTSLYLSPIFPQRFKTEPATSGRDHFFEFTFIIILSKHS